MPSEIHNIKIKIKNGKLDMSDNGHTNADKTDFVVWSLKENSGIDSFKIEKKSGTDVFLNSPHQNGDIWTGEINQNASYNATYTYEIIYWKTGDTNRYTTDPIISIKPSIFLFKHSISNEPIIGSILSFLIGGFGSFLYWRNERMKLKKEVERLKMNRGQNDNQ